MANATKTEDAFENVRDFNERGANQAKEAFDRATSSVADASGAFKDALTAGSKSYVEFSRKSVEMTRLNANAHFDFLNALLASRSVSQAIELQTSYAREQIGVYAEQSKELGALAQKALAETAKPVRGAAEKTARNARSN